MRWLRIVDPADDAVSEGGAPLDDNAFAACMTPFEPFEPSPRLSVAVSGGPDSLALTLLLASWVRRRGGSLLALTVDHGLRPEAAAEADWVGEQLKRRDIPHETLIWRPDSDAKAVQADARTARYARLEARCAAAGLLHLVVAHHLEDQAETLLLRIRARTGPDGLSAMAEQRELRDVRVLRPLLDVPKQRLVATLRAHGQPWIADPSNDDPRHERVRVRRCLPALRDSGITAPGLAAYAQAMGRLRSHLDRARNALAAQAVAVHPAGYARVESAPVLAAPEPVGAAVLARTLRTIGGRDHLPRGDRLSRLTLGLREAPWRSRTLGGCHILPRRDHWLIVREVGRAAALPLGRSETMHYDGRFRIETAAGAPSGCRLAYLGEAGVATLRAARPDSAFAAFPPWARFALPGLWDDAGLREVPHLNWCRNDAVPLVARCLFEPRRAVGEAGFTVAQGAMHII